MAFRMVVLRFRHVQRRRAVADAPSVDSVYCSADSSGGVPPSGPPPPSGGSPPSPPPPPAGAAPPDGSVSVSTGTSSEATYPESVSPLIVASWRSEEHTSELQSRGQLVCRLLPAKKTKSTRSV